MTVLQKLLLWLNRKKIKALKEKIIENKKRITEIEGTLEEKGGA